MENKKSWLYGVVAVAAVAAIAVGFSMKGSYFQGKIGCEGKGCPTTGPLTDPGKGEAYITRDLWAAYLTRNDVGVNSAAKDCATDIIGNQYAKYICYGISKGYFLLQNGEFKPDNYVSRAEGAKGIDVVFKIPSDTSKVYAADVQSTDWYFGYVNGFIKKNCPDTLDGGGVMGNFYPNNLLTISTAKNWVLCVQGKLAPKAVTSPATKPVTGPVTPAPTVPKDAINRASFIRSLVTAAYGQKSATDCKTNYFTDLKDGSTEAKFACSAVEHGIIASKPKFDSKSLVNRAEGLKMIEQAFGLSVAGPMKACGDVDTNNWFFNVFEIAGSNSFPNLYDAAGNCNPSSVLKNTESKAWIDYAKTL